MEKYKNCMILRLIGDKKANKTENMAEIVFLRKVSGDTQCHIYMYIYIYPKNNVNPLEICKNLIHLNICFFMYNFFGNMKI